MSDFSVIVPIYHGEHYISNIICQIESCKEYLQKEDHIEILFLNDAPDAPLELSWSSESVDIVVMNTDRNLGIHGTRLKGLTLCKGEYILFLDQDDIINPKYFKSQMQKLGNYDAVVCEAIHERKSRYNEDFSLKHAVSKDYMIKNGNGIVSVGQVLLRKSSISSIWKRNNMFYNGADDWFLWICMMGERKNFVLNNEILYEHVVTGKNASENLIEMTYSEHEMIQIFEKEKNLNKEELQVLEKTVSRLCLEQIKRADKLSRTYFLNSSWMKLCYNKYSIITYLKDKGYKVIAIYGNGYFGKQLYKEIKRSDINVEYFIDRNADYMKEEIPVFKPENNLPDVDAIVVTVVQNEKEIVRFLNKKVDAKLLCLEELLLMN